MPLFADPMKLSSHDKPLSVPPLAPASSALHSDRQGQQPSPKGISRASRTSIERPQPVQVPSRISLASPKISERTLQRAMSSPALATSGISRLATSPDI